MSEGRPDESFDQRPAARIFRACGIAPLGVFVVLHVLGYARILVGREFPSARRDALLWWELSLELTLVLLPLAYHAAFGLYVLMRPPALRRAPNQDARALDKVQRYTSLLVLAFVFDHFARFRAPLLTGAAVPADTRELLVRELSAAPHGLPLVAAFHLLGIAAVAFHLGYGLYRHPWQRLAWLRNETRRTWVSAAVGLLVLLPASFAIVQLATGKSLPFL